MRYNYIILVIVDDQYLMFFFACKRCDYGFMFLFVKIFFWVCLLAKICITCYLLLSLIIFFFFVHSIPTMKCPRSFVAYRYPNSLGTTSRTTAGWPTRERYTTSRITFRITREASRSLCSVQVGGYYYSFICFCFLLPSCWELLYIIVIVIVVVVFIIVIIVFITSSLSVFAYFNSVVHKSLTMSIYLICFFL